MTRRLFLHTLVGGGGVIFSSDGAFSGILFFEECFTYIVQKRRASCPVAGGSTLILTFFDAAEGGEDGGAG